MQERIIMLKGMHEIMKALNNENAYDGWIYMIPDEPMEEDFEDIAKNDAYFLSTVNTFMTLYNAYFKDGIYLGKNMLATVQE